MSLLFEEAGSGLKSSHLRNKMLLNLPVFKFILVPTIIEIQGYSHLGEGKSQNITPTLTVQALLTAINAICAMFRQSLQLPLDSFSLSFPVGGVWTQIWAPINSLYRLFPLGRIGLIEQGCSSAPEGSLGSPAGVRLLLHCWRKQNWQDLHLLTVIAGPAVLAVSHRDLPLSSSHCS